MTNCYISGSAVLCVRAYAVWKSARSRLVLIVLLTSFIVSISELAYVACGSNSNNDQVSFSVQAYVVGLYISGSRVCHFCLSQSYYLYSTPSRTGSTIGSSTGCTILLTNNKIWISMILLVVADSGA